MKAGQYGRIVNIIKHSVLANTAIKLVGNTIPEDARTMAERMFTGKDEILNLKKRDREYSEFLCFIKDSTRSALKLQVPLGVVNEKAVLDDKKYSLLIEQNRAQYCRPANKAEPQDAGEPITSPPQPDQQAPEPAPAQDQTEDFQKFKIGKRKAF